MKANLMDIGFFVEYLRGKNLSESSVNTYIMILKQFLASNPDLELPDPYMEFVINTAIKRRGNATPYALMHFINYKFSENKSLRDTLKNTIKERNAKQKESKLPGKPLTEEEISNVLLGFEKDKHRIMAYIMYETGLRVGDVLNIPQKGIYYSDDGGSSILKIDTTTKGGKERKVIIGNKDVADVIYHYANNHDFGTGYCFINSKKLYGLNSQLQKTDYVFKQLNYLAFWKDLKQSLNSCGIDRKRFSTHSFRRDFARKFYDKTKDIYQLRDMLGHSDINTSATYLRREGTDLLENYMMMQLSDEEFKKWKQKRTDIHSSK